MQWRRYGGPCPLTAVGAPHFGLLKVLFLEHHVMTRSLTMMEKENNHVQIYFSFDVFPILFEIAGKQLLYINLTQ